MFDQLMKALTHPHKLKIIMALYEKEYLTAQDIKSIAPDIPHASLYRHLNSLEDEGLIKVVKKERVRSMVEKTYSLSLPLDDGLQHQLSNRDGEGLFQLFYGFMLPLLSRFFRYSRMGSIDLMHDPMSFKSFKIKGSPSELRKLTKQIQDLIEPFAVEDPEAQTMAVVLTPPVE
ncbi:MAG: helix-turn-helix domain-containing protein [Tissierellia bacterium]|nr:helix-turn-helix domain-containing protein [Tissierellia bacterium]